MIILKHRLLLTLLVLYGGVWCSCNTNCLEKNFLEVKTIHGYIREVIINVGTASCGNKWELFTVRCTNFCRVLQRGGRQKGGFPKGGFPKGGVWFCDHLFWGHHREYHQNVTFCSTMNVQEQLPKRLSINTQEIFPKIRPRGRFVPLLRALVYR